MRFVVNLMDVLSDHHTDNHENIPSQLEVPGKSIVYKGASPVKEEPFTFDKFVRLAHFSTFALCCMYPSSASQLFVTVRILHTYNF